MGGGVQWLWIGCLLMILGCGIARAETCTPVANLSFCEEVGYATPLAPNVTAESLDDSAQQYYEALQGLLVRFDCGTFYSSWTCDECRQAYKRWICGITFPLCASTASEDNPTTVAPCRQLCFDVVQRCPFTLAFECPHGGEEYADPPHCHAPPSSVDTTSTVNERSRDDTDR